MNENIRASQLKYKVEAYQEKKKLKNLGLTQIVLIYC